MVKKSGVNHFELLGKELKLYRAQAGLSQNDLGRLLGYEGGQYVHFVEKGKITIPRAKLKKWLKSIKFDFYLFLELEQECLARETCSVLGVTYKKISNS